MVVWRNMKELNWSLKINSPKNPTNTSTTRHINSKSAILRGLKWVVPTRSCDETGLLPLFLEWSAWQRPSSLSRPLYDGTTAKTPSSTGYTVDAGIFRHHVERRTKVMPEEAPGWLISDRGPNLRHRLQRMKGNFLRSKSKTRFPTDSETSFSLYEIWPVTAPQNSILATI